MQGACAQLRTSPTAFNTKQMHHTHTSTSTHKSTQPQTHMHMSLCAAHIPAHIGQPNATPLFYHVMHMSPLCTCIPHTRIPGLANTTFGSTCSTRSCFHKPTQRNTQHTHTVSYFSNLHTHLPPRRGHHHSRVGTQHTLLLSQANTHNTTHTHAHTHTHTHTRCHTFLTHT